MTRVLPLRSRATPFNSRKPCHSRLPSGRSLTWTGMRRKVTWAHPAHQRPTKMKAHRVRWAPTPMMSARQSTRMMMEPKNPQE